jgi:hypothetical protein
VGDEVELRSLLFDETVAIDNYKEAAKAALSSASDVADKIVTAAFSVATAYGAAVALVKPKDSSSPLLIVAPFAALALTVGLALYAQSIGVSTKTTTTTEQAKSIVAGAITKKRLFTWLALAVLVAGMLVAGIAVYSTYRPTAGKTTKTVTVWLTPAGTKLVDQACKAQNVTQITGEVDDLTDLSSKRIEIAVGASACAAGAGTLVLPQTAVSVASSKS